MENVEINKNCTYEVITATILLLAFLFVLLISLCSSYSGFGQITHMYSGNESFEYAISLFFYPTNRVGALKGHSGAMYWACLN